MNPQVPHPRNGAPDDQEPQPNDTPLYEPSPPNPPNPTPPTGRPTENNRPDEPAPYAEPSTPYTEPSARYAEPSAPYAEPSAPDVQSYEEAPPLVSESTQPGSADLNEPYDASAGEGAEVYDESTAEGVEVYDASAGEGAEVYDEAGAEGAEVYDESTAEGVEVYDEAGVDGPPVAELAQRVVARLVDLLVVGVPVGSCAEAFFTRHTAETVVAPVAFAAVLLVYEVVQLALWGCTLGKRATGIRVVSVDGSPIRLSQAVVRTAIYALPPAARPVPVLNVLAAIFWLANVGFAAERPYHQALHDRAAGTLVIRA